MPRRSPAPAKPPRKGPTSAPRAPTCGDLGGLGLQDGPCTRDAGWGTDHRGQGRCRDHDEAAEAARQALKSRFVEEFRTGRVSRQKAAEMIGVGATQVWRWRQADPAFEEAVKEAEQESDRHRVGMVEDSMFARIVAGKASPAETIFFLKNRAPDRWRDRVEHVGGNGGPIQYENLSPSERAERVQELLSTAARRALASQGSQN